MHLLPDFSHIYIEKAALQYPRAKSLCSKFAKAQIIEIDNYKEVFNRSYQDWRSQKLSQKIIIALKKEPFLYKGSDVVQNPGYSNFFYNSLVKNCLYDCHYCYLQGMYPTAHMLVFVNLEDYFVTTKNTLEKLEEMYLSISYDTDLLAMENILGYCTEWINFAHQNPNIIIELRTKSANFSAIKSLKPPANFILAWTLSPKIIQEKYETKTPSCKARIKACKNAIEAGWQVRLCFDPIIYCSEWQEIYKEFIEQVFSEIPSELIRDITVGPFRMNNTYFKKVANLRTDSDLIHFPYTKQNDLISYSPSQAKEIHTSIVEKLITYLPKERILSFSLH
jgi:spore photoproduct lyase